MRYLLLSLSILFSHAILADDGKTLHDAACIECHSRMTGGDGSVLYKRDDKLISDLAALHERVKYCSEGSHTDWSDQNIKSVTTYLNETYYNY